MTTMVSRLKVRSDLVGWNQRFVQSNMAPREAYGHSMTFDQIQDGHSPTILTNSFKSMVPLPTTMVGRLVSPVRSGDKKSAFCSDQDGSMRILAPFSDLWPKPRWTLTDHIDQLLQIYGLLAKQLDKIISNRTTPRFAIVDGPLW